MSTLPVALGRSGAGRDAGHVAHIVVGVDGSEQSAEALRWAARAAELRSASLTAVLAWGYLDQHHTIVGERFDPDYGSTDAEAALDAYVVAAVGAEDAARVDRKVVCDLAAAALLGAAEGADLLVVGARGLGGFRGLLLGSVSQHCLHHATCPVAVIRGAHAARPDPDEGTPRVVVGIDGSTGARNALRWAIAEARYRGAVLDVIHAWHPPYLGGHPYAVPAPDPDLYEGAARQVLHEAVAAEDTHGLAQPVEEILTLAGSAASALLEASKGADLVVVGSRGLGGFGELLLGSVSHQVAHHATCPVVVVPPGA